MVDAVAEGIGVVMGRKQCGLKKTWRSGGEKWKKKAYEESTSSTLSICVGLGVVASPGEPENDTVKAAVLG